MTKRIIEGLKHLNQVVKDDKLVSRLLPQLGVPYGETAADVAAALGYGKKKGARKPKARKPRAKKGMGASFADDAVYYSATGHHTHPELAAAPVAAPAVRGRRGRGKRAPKRGKGFLDFAKGLLQAPLAGVVGLSSGLHGALGGLGKKRAGRGKKPTHMLIKL